MAELVALDGEQSGRRIVLTGDSRTLGRADPGDIVVTGPEVSGQHCRLDRGPDGFTITDLDSTNGTFVNDQPVQTANLRDRDVVRLGSSRFLFKDDAPDNQPSEKAEDDPAESASESGPARSDKPPAPDRTLPPKDFSRLGHDFRKLKIVMLLLGLLILAAGIFFLFVLFANH